MTEHIVAVCQSVKVTNGCFNLHCFVHHLNSFCFGLLVATFQFQAGKICEQPGVVTDFRLIPLPAPANLAPRRIEHPLSFPRGKKPCQLPQASFHALGSTKFSIHQYVRQWLRTPHRAFREAENDDARCNANQTSSSDLCFVSTEGFTLSSASSAMLCSPALCKALAYARSPWFFCCCVRVGTFSNSSSCLTARSTFAWSGSSESIAASFTFSSQDSSPREIDCLSKQQCLNFFPLPQGQGSFLPCFF